MRRLLSLAAFTLTIVVSRPLASACDMVFGYRVEPGRDESRPINPQLRYWHAYEPAVSFKLTDGQGRLVPATAIVTPLPSLAAGSLPYGGKSFFTTLEPRQPLTRGRYALHVRRSRHELTIVSTEDHAEPAGIADLRARVITMSTTVGYESDCRVVSEPREFLELSFDEPGEQNLLYEMRWSAAPAPTRGLKSERWDEGRHVIRIPVGWFGDVSADQSPAAIELRAVDLAGNRSRASTVRLPALPERAPKELAPPAERPEPIPEQHAIDLARFGRAALSDDARAAIALLTSVEPSPAGTRSDSEFQTHILDRDQMVSVLATVRGGEGRASIVVPVRIRAGGAAPVLSATELRLLIAALPLQDQSATAISLKVWPDRTASIEVRGSGKSRYWRWRPDEEAIGWAAEHGALGFVRQSIEAGSNIEGRARADSLELTPLMRAAGAGQAATVEFLLERGANPNAKNKEGSTALSRAAAAGHADVMRLLLDAGADPGIPHFDWPPVRHAALNGHTEAVLLLLRRGVSPDARVDAGGNTALMTAAWRGHAETVNALLERGADINARSDDGRTALMYGSGKPNIVKTLLDRGAHVAPRARDGRTALSSAIAAGSVEAVQLLIDANADVNAPGGNGELPLAQARKRPPSLVSERIVRLLIAAGARE